MTLRVARAIQRLLAVLLNEVLLTFLGRDCDTRPLGAQAALEVAFLAVASRLLSRAVLTHAFISCFRRLR